MTALQDDATRTARTVGQFQQAAVLVVDALVALPRAERAAALRVWQSRLLAEAMRRIEQP